MAEVTLTIDGQQVKVPKGTTILQAARQVGREIPTLCYLEGINAIGSCRVCLVEVQGAKTLMPACVTDGLDQFPGSKACQPVESVADSIGPP